MLAFSIISLLVCFCMSFFSIKLDGKSEKTNKAITAAFRILMGVCCAYAVVMIIDLLIK